MQLLLAPGRALEKSERLADTWAAGCSRAHGAHLWTTCIRVGSALEGALCWGGVIEGTRNESAHTARSRSSGSLRSPFGALPDERRSWRVG